MAEEPIGESAQAGPAAGAASELGGGANVLVRAARAWGQVEGPVMILLGLLALLLGVIGFQQLGPPFSDNLFDSTYYSIQLFVLENNIPPGEGSTVLTIASFLAPLVAGYAALRAFIAVFRTQLSFLTLRMARDHIVIVGLSAKGFALARAARDAGFRTAVVEVDPTVEAIGGSRERGIPVLVGDATDPEVLARTGVGRARTLVVATGDDGRNLDVAFSSAALIPRNREGRLTAYIHLDDLALWRLLSARGVASAHATQLRLEFINVNEAAARLLLEAHPPVGDRDGASPRIAVVGAEGIGENLIIGAARLWRHLQAEGAREPLAISVMAPNAEAECARLREEYPALESAASLEPVVIGDVLSDASRWRRSLESIGPHSIFYVCLNDEKEGLAASLALHGVLHGAAPIVLVVRDESTGSARVLKEETFANMHAFGALSRTLTVELFARGTNEVLARALHQDYVAAERARGVTEQENPSLVPWRLLPERLKESNRLAADGIGRKLEEMGCALVPAPFADPANPGFSFEPQQVEMLAELEHERWMSDLTRHGWRSGTDKDPDRRTHRNLAPWEELNEADKDKDRELVRSIPGILAQAGFEIVPVDSVMGSGSQDGTPRA